MTDNSFHSNDPRLYYTKQAKSPCNTANCHINFDNDSNISNDEDTY